ncbi:hypothetical protein Q1W73_04875 [Asticcacaulis sp. ZE23SCel15]|uniref:hypothetical protein n=1 Tax=Asticcacaulis sp. ZE23SCel15 TaxID=3059027 RepID=UPI00265F599B|nr:hypothetical protein [Asticcacaulis sp. ZE23SCel15]WKL58317.1 hypothetical protein Q1W73_04875 [Asticcacaulis sp. ZE23SCel15]
MTQAYFSSEPYFLIHWQDLEGAWRMLAAPDKQDEIVETLKAVQSLSLSNGSEKIVFNIIAATAWLTDDGQAVSDNT